MIAGWAFAGNRNDHTVTCSAIFPNEDSEVVVDRLLDRLGVHGNEGRWAVYRKEVPLHKANEDFYHYMDEP